MRAPLHKYEQGRQRPIPLPERAHPLIRLFYFLANEQQKTMKDIEKRSGFYVGTLSSWRRRHVPRLDHFDAALGALGYELIIRKRRDAA